VKSQKYQKIKAKSGLRDLVEALVKKKTLVKLFFPKTPLQILSKLVFIVSLRRG
jgi:hypothetical protein